MGKKLEHAIIATSLILGLVAWVGLAYFIIFFSAVGIGFGGGADAVVLISFMASFYVYSSIFIYKRFIKNRIHALLGYLFLDFLGLFSLMVVLIIGVGMIGEVSRNIASFLFIIFSVCILVWLALFLKKHAKS